MLRVWAKIGLGVGPKPGLGLKPWVEERKGGGKITLRLITLHRLATDTNKRLDAYS